MGAAYLCPPLDDWVSWPQVSLTSAGAELVLGVGAAADGELVDGLRCTAEGCEPFYKYHHTITMQPPYSLLKMDHPLQSLWSTVLLTQPDDANPLPIASACDLLKPPTHGPPG